jgi:hypothetical protein
MKLTKFLYCFTLLLVVHRVNAQTIEWQQNFGGSNSETLNHATSTPDGGYIIAGQTFSSDGDISQNNGISDAWVVKIDALGVLEWQKNLGGTKAEAAEWVTPLPDGYIVTGSTSSSDGDVTFNNGSSDIWVVKLDLTGAIVWQKSFGGTTFDFGQSVLKASNGGFIVGGTTSSADGDISNPLGLNDYWVAKLSETGEVVWGQNFGGTKSENLCCMANAADGGYVLSGFTASTDGQITNYYGGGLDIWVVKISAEGDLQWQRTLGGSGEEQANAIQATADGGYIVVGQTNSQDSLITDFYGGDDMWIVKLNAQGTLQWQRSYGSSGRDVARYVVANPSGGYWVAGSSNFADGNVTNNQGEDDFWVLQLDANGNIEWQKSFGGSASDVAMTVALSTTGGCMVAGMTNSTDGDVVGVTEADNRHFWVIKLTGTTHTSALNDAFEVTVYPNPSQQWLSIEADPALAGRSFNLTDQRGIVVSSGRLTEGVTTHNVQQLTAGQYYLSVEGLPAFTRKLVVTSGGF